MGPSAATRLIRTGLLLAPLVLAACVTGGGDSAPDLKASMPSDTYESCSGGGAIGEGVNFLSSGGGASTIRLGMTECQLVGILGAPTAASPALNPAAGRHMTLVYANPDGTSTAYVFVNNALKEMNRVTNTQPLVPGAAAPIAAPPS